MKKQINVRVLDIGRPELVLRWLDPVNRAQRQKGAGTGRRREALKAAAQLELDLEAGRYVAGARITWEEFRERYIEEKVALQSSKYLAATCTAFNHVEKFLNPRWLEDIDGGAVSAFQAWLREKGVRDTSIVGYLAVVRAAVRWAHSMGLLAVVPPIRMPRHARGLRFMKSRPIREEEFKEMLRVVPRVCKNQVKKWRFLLRGLWLSGLRIGEAGHVSWDDGAPFRVLLDDGELPRFRILAEFEKGRRDRFLPMTPDFAEFLRTVPDSRRHGRVFNLVGTRCKRPLDSRMMALVIREIGETALVRVNDDGKHASAHDLRRAFATRWAPRVKPAMLMSLMRHENIHTTMRYYVEIDALDIASELWADYHAGKFAK